MANLTPTQAASLGLAPAQASTSSQPPQKSSSSPAPNFSSVGGQSVFVAPAAPAPNFSPVSGGGAGGGAVASPAPAPSSPAPNFSSVGGQSVQVAAGGAAPVSSSASSGGNQVNPDVQKIVGPVQKSEATVAAKASTQSRAEIAAGARQADREYLARELGVAPGAVTDAMLAKLGAYSYQAQAARAAGVSAPQQKSTQSQPPKEGENLGGFQTTQGISYTYTAGKSYGLSTPKGEEIITPISTRISDVEAPKFVSLAQAQNPAVLGGFSSVAGPGIILAGPEPPPALKLTPEANILLANERQAESMEQATGYNLLTENPATGFFYQTFSPFRVEAFFQSLPAYASSTIRYKIPDVIQGLAKNPVQEIVQESQLYKQGVVTAITDPRTYVAAGLGAAGAIAEGNVGFGLGAGKGAGARIVLSEPKATTTFQASADLGPAEFVKARQAGVIDYAGQVQGKDVISIGQQAGFEGSKAAGTFKVRTTTVVEQSNPVAAFLSKPDRSSTEVTGTVEAFQPKEPRLSQGPYGAEPRMLAAAKVNLAGQSSKILPAELARIARPGEVQATPGFFPEAKPAGLNGRVSFSFSTPAKAGEFSPGTASLDLLNVQRAGGPIYQAPDYSLPYNVKAYSGPTPIQSTSEISVPFKVERLAQKPAFEAITQQGLVSARAVEIVETGREVRTISGTGGKIEASRSTIADLVAQQKEGAVEILYKSGKTQRYGEGGRLETVRISGESVLRAKGASLSNEKVFDQGQVFPTNAPRLPSREALPPAVENKAGIDFPKPSRTSGANSIQLQTQTLKGVTSAIAEIGERTAASSQKTALESSPLKQISLDLKLAEIAKLGRAQGTRENNLQLNAMAESQAQVQLMRLLPRQGLATESTQLQAPRQSERMSQITGGLGDVRQGQSSIQRTDQLSRTDQRQDQAQMQRTSQSQIVRLITDIKPPPPLPPPPPPPPNVEMPPPLLGGGPGLGNENPNSRAYGKIKRLASRYTPSLIAVQFNLRGKKEEFKGGYQSGIGIRPIIGKKR